MAEQVIIEFVGDPTGLKPLADAYNELSSQQQDFVKKTNEQFNNTDKVIKNTEKSVDKLVDSFKKVSSTVAGKAISEPLKDLGNQALTASQKLDIAKSKLKEISSVILEQERITYEFKKEYAELNNQLSNSKKAFDPSATAIREKMKVLKQAIDENVLAIKGLRIEEKDLKANIKNLKDQETELSNNTEKVITLKAQLRALKEELAKTDEGSERFIELSVNAAKLEDQIGDVNERVRVLASDTFKFDAAVDAVRGITAAFSVAQGAAALFGQENEDVQKALLKVQGATALLTGVQELANLATGQSAVKLAIENKLLAVKTFVTTQATVATRAFTAALIATGVGAAIVALGAIVAYWEEIGAGINKALEYLGIYEKTQTTVKKNSKDYNDKIKENIQLEEDLQKVRSGAKGGEEKIRNLKLEIEILKALGAGQNELKEKTIELKKAEIEQSFNKLKYIELLIKERGEGKALIAARAAELDNYKQLEKQLKALNVERKELSKIELPTLLGGENEKKVEDAIKKVATMYVENMKRANKDIASGLGEILGKLPDPPPIQVPVEIKNAVDLENYFKEQLPRDIIAGMQTTFDAVFEISNENRQRQAEADMAEMQAKKEMELNNENLTEAQRLAIQEKYRRQEAALRVKQFKAEKQAKITQATINGALAVTNILATVPGGPLNPAAIAGIALAAITTAAQIGVISAQKPPAFAKGTKNAPKGMALVGEEGPELVYLNAGSKVITAPETKKILDKYQVPNIIKYDEVVKDSQGMNIIGVDPDAVAKAVAKEIAKQDRVSINIDERGFVKHIIKGRSRMEILNSKFVMK